MEQSSVTEDRPHGRPFYYLMMNSWYVKTDFTICTYHEFILWYHEL